MSVLATDLVLYMSVNAPTDDTSTTGGAIDTNTRVLFTQFSANAICEVVSDGADVRTVTITGRLADGTYATEVLTLNGTTAVDSANTYERILSAVASATSGTRTITVKQGVAGSTLATIPINEKAFAALFIKSVSAASIQTRYQKTFFKNNNGSTALTSATVKFTADPGTTLNIGLETSLDGSTTTTNRLTAPGGVSFVGLSTPQNVANSQNLTATHAQAVWFQETLAANNAAVRSSFTAECDGSTT